MTHTDPDVAAPILPGWRMMTEKEIRSLRKGERISIAYADGIEEREFRGITETGLIITKRDATRPLPDTLWAVGRHRLAVYSPQIENMHQLYDYNF